MTTFLILTALGLALLGRKVLIALAELGKLYRGGEP
jgi:hypothetical protein